ncbi:hypothetical protein BDR26DRAFT_874694 [Obelidium mucronatum]|nr:hypothetical protein BDR26DRAFT_874694 [Obelidium mucronatum]
MRGELIKTQLHALICKSFTHQKRQVVSNVFCVSLCPILMTLTCAMIGQVVQNILVKMSGPPKDILFCSNVNALESRLNWPITDLSSSLLPQTDDSSVPGAHSAVTHVNFLSFFDFTAASGTTTGYSLKAIKPCRYSKFKTSPYSMDPLLEPSTTILESDATYQAQPLGGFFSSNAISYLAKQLITGQLNEAFLVGVSSGVSNFRPPGFSLNQKIVPALGFLPMNSTMGILETIEPRFRLDLDPFRELLTGFKQVPVVTNSDYGMDGKLAELIKSALINVTAVDTSALLTPNPSIMDVLYFFVNVSQSIVNLPFGGILFTQLNQSTSNYKYSFHIGTDPKLEAIAAFPEPDFRSVLVQAQLSNAFLRSSSKDLSEAVITQSIRVFPILYSTGLKLPLDEFIGQILYPFGVSFLLPLFAVELVREKETKNGIKTWIYSLSQFISFFVIYAISATVFAVSGYSFKLQIFTMTSPGVLFVLLLVWGLVQISMSFVIASVCQRSSMALASSFLIVLLSVVASISLNSLYPLVESLPGYYLAWPPFAFIRAISVVNQASYSALPYTLSNLQGNNQVLKCVHYLLAASVAMQLTASYLETIIPSNLGVTYPWHWPISFCIKKAMQYSTGEKPPQSITQEINQSESTTLSINTDLEGSDVLEEQHRVSRSKNQLIQLCPLVVHNLKKNYPGLDTSSKQKREIKMALNGVSFAVEKDVVFGLLGPNGAGKSTLMSILTGVTQKTSGNAWIDSLDLDSMDDIQTRIGICLQDDILWNDLTVYEHLLFYSRLKGMKANQKEAIITLMHNMRLNHLATRTARYLSGGEKRRLSIAMAMAGNPKLIFLDEPTTGLDPEVRRQIWGIIKEARKGRTIILTTHAMEEADVCCNRIGIMLQGNLKCIGPHTKLKQIYGNGFRLSFSVLNGFSTEQATNFVEAALPDDWVLVESINSHHIYEFSPKKGDVFRIMTVLEESAAHFGIIDWDISQTTLENIFLKLVSNDAVQS